MMLVAKRRLRESWRDAVERRAGDGGNGAACLARFDRLLAGGASEAEAAFRALEAEGLLWPLPDVASPPSDPTAGAHSPEKL